MRTAALAASLIVLAGCGCGQRHTASPSPRVIAPTGDVKVAWTEAELTHDPSIRPLHADGRMSAVVLRLQGSEKPHRHVEHDLVVVLLTGRARLHLADRVVEAAPGDVMEIPRGVPHWAENIGPGACTAYVVSTPPLDPQDNVPLTPAAQPAR